MKKSFILLFLSLFLTENVFAYVPLVREGTRWIYYFCYESWDYGGSYQCDDANYIYEFCGDTIVNQVLYKKLYKYWFSDFGHFKPERYKPAELLREEGHKVYQKWGNRERLLYDFDCPTNAEPLLGYEEMMDFVPIDPIEVFGETYSGWSARGGYIKIIEGVGFWGNWGDLIDYPGDYMYGEFHTYYTGPTLVVNADNHVIILGQHYRSTFDVNRDGAVDGGDVNALINVILGTDDTYSGKADINSDGSVDAVDLNMLIEVVLY